MIKTIKRLWRRRKAISPVIATILLIALTVSAAAIVYFVIVPLLQGKGELVLFGYELSDNDGTSYADEIDFDLQNIGSAELTISTVTVTKDDVAVSWSIKAANNSVVLTVNTRQDVTIEATGSGDELGYGETVLVTLGYDNGDTLTVEFKVPGKFSKFVLLYEEDFESGLPTGWVHTEFLQHGGGTHGLDGWVLNEESGNHYWRCTNNDCQFIILEDPLYSFGDVNVSYDLRTNDDDANGVIFRYDDSGQYAKFYIVVYTRDHPSTSNAPFSGEADDFDWVTTDDRLSPNMITAYYVEQDAEGWNWEKLAEASWSRQNNRWYSWRVIADGTDMGLFIDNSDTATLEWTDSQIASGYVGLISFANSNSHYDNIYAWVTETI